MNREDDTVYPVSKDPSPKLHAWQEIGLVAIPIVVICLTVAFSPPTSKGFWATIVSKPEWYFLTLVFCIEAHRDRAKIEKRAQRADDLGTFFITVAAVLAGLAAAASLAISPTVASVQGLSLGSLTSLFERILDMLQNPLQAFAIPIFISSASWSARCKRRLRCIEIHEDDENHILLDVRRPRVYSVDHQNSVKNFYDVVAGEYSKRNEKTKGIRNAQDQVIQEIRGLAKRTAGDTKASVLDLGGGTGHNVYNTLRNEEMLDWTSLDLSPGMTEKFHDNFPSVRAISGDCFELEKCLANEHRRTYDAIVLSFSLSSMPKNLAFSSLCKFLKPRGCVLIADIHPGYVAKSPCFDVEIGTQMHALKLRKVEPFILEHEAYRDQLIRTAWKLFENERGEIYSFFVKFERKEDVGSLSDRRESDGQ